MTLMLPFFLLPLVGLAIDATKLYIVQAKLSAACDGAVLGAGRLLGTAANTEEIANELFNANFPAGFWGSTNLRPEIHAIDLAGAHKIDISATVDVPMYFLRIIGAQTPTVAAAAQATRKDARVAMILDRSGSMNNPDPVTGLNIASEMKKGAKTFVGMFTPGVDQMAIVALSGSSVVAYPAYAPPYSTDVNGGGGANDTFGITPTTGPAIDQINKINADGWTGTADALALAWLELQKAHFRDLAANGVDNAMNSIVLFTDGVPTSLTVAPNDAGNNVLKTKGTTTTSTTSSCKWNPWTTDATTHMLGYISSGSSDPPFSLTTNGAIGLTNAIPYDTGHTLTYWLNNPYPGGTPMNPLPANAITGCTATMQQGNVNDLARVPPFDIYGTSTDGNEYSHSSLVYRGVTYDPFKPRIIYHFAMAAWNATDNVGERIRQQTAMMPVAIHVIGYDGRGGIDEVLLKRLANTMDSTSYDPAEQTGRYRVVHSADDMVGAFADIASSILRLAR